MINPQKELPEDEFINEGYRKNPFPFLFWFFFLTAFLALVLGGRFWSEKYLSKDIKHDAFSDVTNRQFSIFLWQNTSFMRSNVKNKSGYLPAFSATSPYMIDPGAADGLITAPPELLFLYHTWHRLLKNERIDREITPSEFKIFLNDCPEWKPEYWTKAPPKYVKLVEALSTIKIEDLSALPVTTLPTSVRQAFTGRKNYFYEGKKINAVSPTYGEMQTFLIRYPHYARNYWRNIVDGDNVHYLKTLTEGTFKESDRIPQDQLVSFLKTAFYNAQEAAAEHPGS